MIEKITLRDQVRQYLQEEMLNGKIGFGERLSLADIARKIDVSVTPIREALTQLEQAGIIESIANRGFFVPHLSVSEAKEIYPIIISLECLGISQSSYSDEEINILSDIQSDFEKCKNEEAAVKLDLRFHEILLSKFENSIAKRILADLKVRVFFYELEYMNSGRHKSNSMDCHRKIIEALSRNNKQDVMSLIEENWMSSHEFIIKYYDESVISN